MSSRTECSITWVAQIAKARGQGARNPQTLIELTQQEHAAIAAEMSCGEVSHDLARTQVIKEQRLKVGVKLGRIAYHIASL